MTNIGLFGAGMIANVHADAINAVGSKIIAVHDPRAERAADFSSAYGCDNIDSVSALLQRDDVESVVIAVPNDQHADLAIAALRAGKNVLLEKPMAMSLQQCDDILQARDASGKQLQMGFVCRFSPTAMKAKELIDAGRIGKVHHVHATLLRSRGIPGLGGWFTTKARSGGGCLIDIGVHLIDLVMHMTSANNPLQVSGTCTQAFTASSYAYDEMWSTPVNGGTFDVEDRVHASIRDASGALLQFDVAWATHIPEDFVKDGLRIEGDQGAMMFDLWADECTIGFSEQGTPRQETVKVSVQDAWEDAFQAEHRAFAETVHNQELHSNAGSGEDGRLVQSVVEAIYQSNLAQKEVAIAL